MLIIPAIDLIGGKCVRLHQGDYSKETIYGEDPVKMAIEFREAGTEWLHLVDLEGARSGNPVHHELAAKIAKESGLKVEFGGGIRSLETGRALIDAGINRVVYGSAIVNNLELAELVFKDLGERAVAGVDSKHGKVAVSGWETVTDVHVEDLCTQLQSLGCKRIIQTDISKDGTLEGPSLELLKSLVSLLAVPIIASGGVGTLDDIKALKESGVEAAITGKAIYEGRFTIQEAIVATGKS